MSNLLKIHKLMNINSESSLEDQVLISAISPNLTSLSDKTKNFLLNLPQKVKDLKEDFYDYLIKNHPKCLNGIFSSEELSKKAIEQDINNLKYIPNIHKDLNSCLRYVLQNKTTENIPNYMLDTDFYKQILRKNSELGSKILPKSNHYLYYKELIEEVDFNFKNVPENFKKDITDSWFLGSKEDVRKVSPKNLVEILKLNDSFFYRLSPEQQTLDVCISALNKDIFNINYIHHEGLKQEFKKYLEQKNFEDAKENIKTINGLYFDETLNDSIYKKESLETYFEFKFKNKESLTL